MFSHPVTHTLHTGPETQRPARLARMPGVQVRACGPCKLQRRQVHTSTLLGEKVLLDGSRSRPWSFTKSSRRARVWSRPTSRPTPAVALLSMYKSNRQPPDEICRWASWAERDKSEVSSGSMMGEPSRRSRFPRSREASPTLEEHEDDFTIDFTVGFWLLYHGWWMTSSEGGGEDSLDVDDTLTMLLTHTQVLTMATTTASLLSGPPRSPPARPEIPSSSPP